MEELIVFALPFVWMWFTMYWAYTKGMTKETSWTAWKFFYVLSVVLMGVAVYRGHSWLWGGLSMVSLFSGELSARVSQGAGFPYVVPVVARLLGVFIAVILFLWIML